MYNKIMEEIWKDIPGYEGFYQVSTNGRVRRIMTLGEDKNGYKVVTFSKNGQRSTQRVHRLVAQAFIPNMDNKNQINHKNGIKSDNCVDNLEWANNSENQLHSHRILGHKSVSHDGKQVRCVETGKVYESISSAARAIGRDRCTINDALRHRKGCTRAGGYHWEWAYMGNTIVKK